jgi:hypothetical protein
MGARGPSSRRRPSRSRPNSRREQSRRDGSTCWQVCKLHQGRPHGFGESRSDVPSVNTDTPQRCTPGESRSPGYSTQNFHRTFRPAWRSNIPQRSLPPTEVPGIGTDCPACTRPHWRTRRSSAMWRRWFHRQHIRRLARTVLRAHTAPSNTLPDLKGIDPIHTRRHWRTARRIFRDRGPLLRSGDSTGCSRNCRLGVDSRRRWYTTARRCVGPTAPGSRDTHTRVDSPSSPSTTGGRSDQTGLRCTQPQQDTLSRPRRRWNTHTRRRRTHPRANR